MSNRESHRSFICKRCRRLASICRSCDRGQRYCGPDCAKSARLQAQREANRRYQASQNGREAHRARQARYRERQRGRVGNVTDHSGLEPDFESNSSMQPSAPARSHPSAATCCGCGNGPVEFFRWESFRWYRRPPRLRRRRAGRKTRSAVDRQIPADSERRQHGITP